MSSPTVALRHRLMHAARALTTPLLPDDFLTVLNPMWTTREPRGRIDAVKAEAAGAVTLVIRPSASWPGRRWHRPGQYVAVGVDVDGVRHWRTYSLTNPPGADRLSVTVGPVEGGLVSSHLARNAAPGDLVHLGATAGEFVLPASRPAKLLFVTAGTGITPVLGMLRGHRAGSVFRDAVLVHSARRPGDVLFGEELRTLARATPGLRLIERHTRTEGRLGVADLDTVCPDWAERETYACGPSGLLDDLTAHWYAAGRGHALHLERFRPLQLRTGGAGGTVRFLRSGRNTVADGSTTLLHAGERAGALLPSGCRMGICRTCIGPLRSGAVRDLRTGDVCATPGEMVQTCICAPACDVEIDL